MRLQTRRLSLRATSCAILLPLSVAHTLSSEPAALDNPVRRDSCVYGTWSGPRWLEKPTSSLAATRFVGLASIEAAQGNGVPGSPRPRVEYAVGVAGSPAIKFTGAAAAPAQWPPQLRVFRLDGPSPGGPRGAFWFAYPRTAMDQSGSLHVVWAEPDEKLPSGPSVLHGAMPPLRSLWHATLRGGTWSRPRQIYRGMRLEWDDDNASRLLVDGRGGLHVAFVADDASGPGILYLRSNGASSGSWRVTKAVQPAGIYFDLALTPDHRAAIVFVQSGGVAQPRANVLFMTQSSDGGTSWTRPVEISTPDEDPAFEPHVFFDRDEALRVVWVQQSLGAFTGGRVWQAILADTGRRAASALALPSDVMTSHSQAAIDGCGTIHFVTQWYPHGDSELRYARVTSGSWSGWSRPFDTPGAHASLTADAAAVHVVWNSSSRSPVDGTYDSGLVHAALPLSRPELRNARD